METPTLVPEGIESKKRKVEPSIDANASFPTTSDELQTRMDRPTKNGASTQLLVKLLSPKAKLPTRGSAFAAGYDLCSAEQKVVPARGKALVDTQLSIAVPFGHYGRVAPRSGLGEREFYVTTMKISDYTIFIQSCCNDLGTNWVKSVKVHD